MAGRTYVFQMDPADATALARAVSARRGGITSAVLAGGLAVAAATLATSRPDLAWAPVGALLLAAAALAWGERRAQGRRSPLTAGTVRARLGPEGVEWRARDASLAAGWSGFGAPRVAGPDLLLWRGPGDVLPLPGEALAMPAAEAADKLRAWIARREGGAPIDVEAALPAGGRRRWRRAAERPEGRRPVMPDLVFALALLWPLASSLALRHVGWGPLPRAGALAGPMLALLLLAGWLGWRARMRARAHAPGWPRRWRVTLAPEGLEAEAPDLRLWVRWGPGARAVATPLGVGIALGGGRLVPIPAAVLGDRTPREVARVVNRWIRLGGG